MKVMLRTEDSAAPVPIWLFVVTSCSPNVKVSFPTMTVKGVIGSRRPVLVTFHVEAEKAACPLMPLKSPCPGPEMYTGRETPTLFAVVRS
jgi:hypothetical protein